MAGKTEKPDSPSVKVVSTNRRARHEYEILETFECGLALQGYEVKSIREGRVSIADGHAAFRGNEAFIENMHITPYELATGFSKPDDARRERKLLLHRKEIGEIARGVDQKGFTVVATRVYLKRGRAKIEIALAKGKRQYDKRQSIARRDSERDVERAMRD